MREEVDIEIRMKPQGQTLAKYMLSWLRVMFIMGPLGSGKTIQTCEKLFQAMINQEPNAQGIRPTRWYAVRNTYMDLTGTTIKDWLSLFGELGKYKEGSKTPPTHYLKFRLEDGTRVDAELIFLALDRPEHVRKLRGAQVTGFWLNEVKELYKAVVDMCDLRHGRYPSMASGGVDPTWHGMMGDTNAMDEDHWYYRLAEEEALEDWEFFRQPGGVMRIGDGEFLPNPNAENLNNLPDGYYTIGMQGKSRDWIAVNLGNEYGSVMEGKPVYPEYNDGIHLAKAPLEPYRKLPLLLGWDFGRTPCVIIGQLTLRGQLRILDELVSENMGIRTFATTIVPAFMAKKYPGMTYNSHGDPAGVTKEGNEKSAFMELLAAGFKTYPARTNYFSPRRESVAGFLTKLVDGEPAFLLSPTCKVLRKGFLGGYHFRRMQVPGDERFTEEADKNAYSHPHDGLQYLALEAEAPPMDVARSRKTGTKPLPRQSTYSPASTSGGY